MTNLPINSAPKNFDNKALASSRKNKLPFMKLSNTLFLLFLFTINFIYSQDWVKTNITPFATIDFPVETELIETQRETVYTAEDEFGYYIVSVRKLTNRQSSQITEQDIPTIYQGVVQGAIDASNAKVVSMAEIFIQNIPALELEYNTQSNPELPSQRFKRIIYLNQNIITIDFWPITNQKDVANQKRATYFNSFSIDSIDTIETKKSSEIGNKQNEDAATGYNTGFFIGQIIFFVILLAFLIGLFLLIRYLIRKNSKKNLPINPKEKPREQITKTICQNCNAENKSDTKYCSSCGYELRKI